MKDAAAIVKTLTLPVQGMSCASCVGRVERALGSVPGVAQAQVNLAAERADIAVSDAADTAELINAITDLGYKVPLPVTTLAVEGMSCAGCVGRVERALSAVPGVASANVNLATQRAVITGNASVGSLVDAVAETGKSAHALDAGQATPSSLSEARDQEAQLLQRRVLVSVLLTVPIFVLEMGGHLIPAFHHLIMSTIGLQASALIQFVLCTAVLAGPGRAFYATGIPALLRGTPDMNSLVAVGTAAAYVFSAVAVFLPGILPAGTAHIYFEAAAVIVTLILVGRWMEARAKGRSSAAIERLIGLAPHTARVQRAGVFQDIPLGDVALGDILELRPGDRVPVDGRVTRGSSYVDESMISGEPVPVSKGMGDAITGGTVNQTGHLEFRATAIGQDTMLARIIRMVEDAQGGKLPIQALVDKVTLYFVPAIFALAVLTFGIWLWLGPDPALSFALVNAVAVLIIACPCAMGLATPTSIMVGTGRGAELGVLFRKGEALQHLQSVQVVALDKTGTLTMGAPRLTDLHLAPGLGRPFVLAQIAAVEQLSEHPIARAIVQAAFEDGLNVPEAIEFQSLTGMGAGALVAGVRVDVGADRYMASLGHDVDVFRAQADQLAAQGKTPLYAAIGGQLAAVIAVADPIKPTSAEAIAALQAQGLTVAMITGDNAGTAQAIAAQLGIDHVVAEVLPDGKVAALRDLRARHGALAFVGDGINDAPALAEADVGIAIGTGTDIAIEAADVVLVSGALTGVPKAIELSVATIRNIRQNLFWAFAYNAALVPVAAGLLYPGLGLLLSPIFAAGAMALSSVFVVGNALRLRGWQPRAAA